MYVNTAYLSDRPSLKYMLYHLLLNKSESGFFSKSLPGSILGPVMSVCLSEYLQNVYRA